MKNNSIYIILFQILFISKLSFSSVDENFNFSDRVNIKSKFRFSISYFKQMGVFNREGNIEKYGSFQWFSISSSMSSFKNNYITISLYPGIFIRSEAPFVSLGFTDTWLSFQLKFSKYSLFSLRSAFKFKGHGPVGTPKNFLRQNDLDFGLLYGKRKDNFFLETSVSYRIRLQGVTRNCFGFIFDKPGDEIHFKFDLGNLSKTNYSFSGFIIGYIGFNKKLSNNLLINSQSSKLSIGGRIHLFNSKDVIGSLSLLINIRGKNDYKGWFLNLNFGDY